MGMAVAAPPEIAKPPATTHLERKRDRERVRLRRGNWRVGGEESKK
jgi:hypothetical protein